MEEARLWIKIAQEHGKLALFGLYSFKEWKNGKPNPESVILDVIALKGPEEILEKLGTKFLKEGKQSLFMFDGQDYLLFVEHDGTPLEKVKEPENTELIKDVYFKFTYPNTPNGITGEKARIIKRFKDEKEKV